MINQTQAITISVEPSSVDINDGQISVSTKEGDSVRITGIDMETWLKEFRYVVSSFEWRSPGKQQEHKNQLELLQDSLADVLQKINAKTTQEA